MAANFMIGLLLICCFVCIIIAMAQHDEIQELKKRVKPVCIYDVDARCKCPDCQHRRVYKNMLMLEEEGRELRGELRDLRQHNFVLKRQAESDYADNQQTLEFALTILGFSFTPDKRVQYTEPGINGPCMTKDYKRVIRGYKEQRMFPIMEWEDYGPGDINVSS